MAIQEDVKLDTISESAKLASITSVAGGVAHEINNLMGSIVGNAGLIRPELKGKESAIEMLASIEDAAEAAAGLTQKLLAFIKGEEGQLVTINLNPLVCNVLIREEQELAPDVKIVRHNDPDLWDVAADDAQMRQLLLNLANNAVEAIEGKGRVSITTRNLEVGAQEVPQGIELPPGRYAYVSIEDTGAGMDEETMGKIFEPGFSTKGSRAGQGLVVADEIVRQHKGHIAVNSTPGQGSVFRIYLPAVKSVKKPVETRKELPRGTETVLIIDDDYSIVVVMRKILERLGYTTLSASNGEEAVEIAKNHDGVINLALLDMVMPVMGGQEAFPLLRKIRPEMKVIICTGFQKGPVIQAQLKNGASACLVKPFKPELLAQTLRNALDGKTAPVM